MGKVFVFDETSCNGCYGCQFACKDEHYDNDWMPYQKPQPLTGHFWMKLCETTHGQVPRVRIEYRPVPCQHCDAGPCLEHPAFYKRDDGLVILDPEKAADKSIMDEKWCPYHAIYWNDELGIAQKCNGCAHLVDAGEEPHCVDLCVLNTWNFGDEEDFKDEIAQAEVFHPEYGTKPRVYYLNMPHLFIGGGVWDPEADEVIIGAKITLWGAGATPDTSRDYDPYDNFYLNTTSDEFGDFWFRKLDPGKYHIAIEAEGFKTVEKEIDLTESLNIGDFALERA